MLSLDQHTPAPPMSTLADMSPRAQLLNRIMALYAEPNLETFPPWAWYLSDDEMRDAYGAWSGLRGEVACPDINMVTLSVVYACLPELVARRMRFRSYKVLHKKEDWEKWVNKLVKQATAGMTNAYCPGRFTADETQQIHDTATALLCSRGSGLADWGTNIWLTRAQLKYEDKKREDEAKLARAVAERGENPLTKIPE